MSLTVRIGPDAHRALKALAEQSGRSMQETLADAVEALRRQRFGEELNAGFERLRRDPKEWEAYQRELATWDATLSDGLKD